LRNTAHDYAIRGLRRQADLERKAGHRSIFTRSRQLEPGIDWHQIPLRSSALLNAADGKLLFLVGHSMVGGPDVVGP
jgi:hypothetical protein